MKFEYTLTGNWENAFRGLRHPMESYSRSDSEFGLVQPYGDEDLNVTTKWLIKDYPELEEGSSEWVDKSIERSDWIVKNGIIKYDKLNDTCEYAFIGPNDMDLAKRMIKAGTPNDKFLRQIFVSVDITAPLYWFKELDTYKVATVANSTSTMHKLASTPITLDCFETDDYDDSLIMNTGYKFKNRIEYEIIPFLEGLRQKYLETKDKRYWKELIRWLPEGWLQTRTWTANYSTLRNIIHWRRGHKLSEWSQFIDWCKTLPYADDLLFYAQTNEN